MPCGNAALQWMCGQGVREDYKKVLNVQTDFRQLVEDMIRKLPVEEVELFLVQAWMIWTQRNVATKGSTLQDPSQLVKRASVFLAEFRASKEQLAIPNSIVRQPRWVPPPGNCIILFELKHQQPNICAKYPSKVLHELAQLVLILKKKKKLA